MCLPHVCIHVKRYTWARERPGHCAAKDKCLFNWSWGQTALILWQDHSLLPCGDSSWLNGGVSPVLAFTIYLNYIWLTHVGPLWTVHFVLMGYCLKRLGINYTLFITDDEEQKTLVFFTKVRLLRATGIQIINHKCQYVIPRAKRGCLNNCSSDNKSFKDHSFIKLSLISGFISSLRLRLESLAITTFSHGCMQ